CRRDRDDGPGPRVDGHYLRPARHADLGALPHARALYGRLSRLLHGRDSWGVARTLHRHMACEELRPLLRRSLSFAIRRCYLARAARAPRHREDRSLREKRSVEYKKCSGLSAAARWRCIIFFCALCYLRANWVRAACRERCSRCRMAAA